MELHELLQGATIDITKIHIQLPGQASQEQAKESYINPVVKAVRNTDIGGTVSLPNADGTTTEWIVLTNDGKQAELITKDVVSERRYHRATPYPKWSESDIREYLNNEYYNSLSADVKNSIKTQTLTTATDGNWGDFETTEDKVYLLAESNDSDRAVTPSGYELTTEQLRCLDEVGAYWYWLRSPRFSTTLAGMVRCSAGTIDYDGVAGTFGVRPAITIDLK